MPHGPHSSACLRFGAFSRAISWFVFLAVFSVYAFHAQAEESRNVLILSSFDSLLPVASKVIEAFRKTLVATYPGKVTVYTEYLDAEHFPTATEQFRAYFDAKYKDRQPDIVVVIGRQALEFAVANPLGRGAVLFANIATGTPIPAGRVSGVQNDWDIVKTVQLALQLVPSSKHLAVVSGASTFDRYWENRARTELRSIENQIAVTYLAGLPMQDLLEQISHLPQDSVILYTTVFTDGAGHDVIPSDVLRDIAARANAPVFSIADAFVPLGIVGGYISRLEGSGEDLARLATKVLLNPTADLPAPAVGSGSGYVVDEPTMRRWGLDEHRLPPGTRIIPGPPTVWSLYRNYLLVALAVLLAQTLTIVVLIAQARRRRRAEARLRDSEERITLAASSVALGFWALDEGAEQFWVSLECRAMLGLAVNVEITPEAIWAAVHPQDKGIVGDCFAQARLLREPSEVEFRVVHPDGNLLWIRALIRAVQGQQGRLLRMTGTVRDVTAAKHAEAEAAQQRSTLAHLSRVSMVGELSGTLAHEINQPLTAIVANANAAKRLLARPDPDLAETSIILADIAADGARAGSVIQRLRALIRKEAAQNTRLSLTTLVATTVALCRSELIARSVTARTTVNDDRPFVSGDAILLQQVLINLIINAADAMRDSPTERELHVETATSTAGLATVTVSDTGPGLSAEARAHLFEPFFTTKPNGLGLGLSICRTIATSHGGSLGFFDGDAGGTRVILSLPLDNDEADGEVLDVETRREHT